MADTGVSGALTDGTGVSSLTVPKVIKDAIADALLSLPGALIAINVTGLEQALAAPLVVAVAVGDVLIRVLYRTVLKWAQT
jgi:ABC-type antimicrobial peptide transport system permease subunit